MYPTKLDDLKPGMLIASSSNISMGIVFIRDEGKNILWLRRPIGDSPFRSTTIDLDNLPHFYDGSGKWEIVGKLDEKFLYVESEINDD